MARKTTPGERLRAWRESKGWTQMQLAVAIDAQPSAVSNYERGAVIPSLRAAARIERECGIPASVWVAEA